MELTEFDRDEILTNFLTDYIDGNLGRAERRSFEEYLARHDEERAFVRKAMMGKRALSRLRSRIDISGRKKDASSLTSTDTH